MVCRNMLKTIFNGIDHVLNICCLQLLMQLPDTMRHFLARLTA